MHVQKRNIYLLNKKNLLKVVYLLKKCTLYVKSVFLYVKFFVIVWFIQKESCIFASSFNRVNK